MGLKILTKDMIDEFEKKKSESKDEKDESDK